MNTQKEFGDFQTPDELADRVVSLVANKFGVPQRVVEPTAGLGAFLKAAASVWGKLSTYEGFEINRDYVNDAGPALRKLGIDLSQADFFEVDWKQQLNGIQSGPVFVIGNPPWVTNSDLGQIGSGNLPTKSNFQGMRGFDARTGKANFDISEWMLIRLIEALPPSGVLAMLCKTMTARKVLRHFWKTGFGRAHSSLFRIDAKAHFDVAVDACLFVVTGRSTDDRTATIYEDLDYASQSTTFGFVDGHLVSNLEAYQRYRHLDGGSSRYTWRSGVKHDASKIMEFRRDGDQYINGLGEEVTLEGDFVYPLLKSSDLGNGRVEARKLVLVTQTHTGEDTALIRSMSPKTWGYLSRHAPALDARRSSIYLNRPRFSMFGIGPYSFAPWKVAISGLYKSFSFVVIPPVNGRAVMVDDTCYTIPCNSEAEAVLLHELLTSDISLSFLRSLVFMDSKRPITIDVLRRISLVQLAAELGRADELEEFYSQSSDKSATSAQLTLLMEPKPKQSYGREASRRGALVRRNAELP